MNALAMDFPDNSFDLVWACESGEHMPDKKKYVEEMVRVLKPGGTLVIATWCQRDDRGEPFSARELTNLNYLYKEWAHPYFISIDAYAELVGSTGKMGGIDTDDWTRQTIASWRHSVWAGVWDPLPVFSKPKVWYKTVRDIVCLERMHRAFDVGLMQYGMIKAVKTAR
jgi:MPBQ/MSBQ methyltransferase